METPEQIVNRIIKRYGDVIDLRRNPSVMIEILRQFQLIDDGGAPPGGTPSPPGPTSIQGVVRNEDLMRAILRVARELAAIKKLISAKPAVKSTARTTIKKPAKKAGRRRM
jgi:hypothetical protein